ncbi:hypothetical protein CROQUDRAFT_111420 [Cronartium quercuum f. sp. fusiforme G11]|uniref:Uncharacterized protein n=1 Tax=Cronartium quercuum f. sp. fusiforme G11 TaxID=708437 RepID=A0A9P6N8S9_9BASI|nr:hypothetical protein CROQUDRAFT_111420 [Cronartium quercuum f. sp. fusiforme G11]
MNSWAATKLPGGLSVSGGNAVILSILHDNHMAKYLQLRPGGSVKSPYGVGIHQGECQRFARSVCSLHYGQDVDIYSVSVTLTFTGRWAVTCTADVHPDVHPATENSP